MAILKHFLFLSVFLIILLQHSFHSDWKWFNINKWFEGRILLHCTWSKQWALFWLLNFLSIHLFYYTENVRWLVVHFYGSLAELIIFGLVKRPSIGCKSFIDCTGCNNFLTYAVNLSVISKAKNHKSLVK